jgi:hypothetical protein
VAKTNVRCIPHAVLRALAEGARSWRKKTRKKNRANINQYVSTILFIRVLVRY